MAEHVDIAIIGGGPGGYSTALRAAQLGKTVALVERDATLGGTCLNRGCIPSKALITATRSIEDVRRASRFGVTASLEAIDFGKLRDYRRHTVDTMVKGVSGMLAHRGVTVYRGTGSVSAPGHVLVSPHPTEDGDKPGTVQRFIASQTPEDAGGQVELQADHIVLATGSKPRSLPGNPFAGALIDSTQALALDQFPSSAVIVGAGAIAVEFASMWRAAGADVTLLIRKDRVLSGWDTRTGATLTRELKRRGIAVVTHAQVGTVDTGENLGVTVHYQREGAEGEERASADIALAAIGRDPLTTADWFSGNGLALDHGYVVTDDYGRTNVDGIWAVGDITKGPSLAHRAFAQGLVVAECIAGLDPVAVDDLAVPDVVFSTPEAASVGLTLDEAKLREDVEEAEETIFPMLSNSRMLMDEAAGSLSIVSGKRVGDGGHASGNPVVLGAHLVSPDASDLIAEAMQLVGNAIELSDAARLIHPHPTLSETIGEALLKADGRPLHTR